MKSFNEVIEGKQIEVLVYSGDDEVKISELATVYVFSSIFGKNNDEYYCKALICATPNKIYMLYHTDLFSGNLGKIIYRDNAFFAMDDDSFDAFVLAYDLEPDGLRQLNKRLDSEEYEPLGISKLIITAKETELDDFMRQRYYEPAFRAVCFLQKEKQKKSRYDEERWDQYKEAKRAATSNSAPAANICKFQRLRQDQSVPALADIQKCGLSGGLAVKLSDCSLTTLVLRAARFGVRASCVVAKNGVKWVVVQCDEVDDALLVVKNAVKIQ